MHSEVIQYTISLVSRFVRRIEVQGLGHRAGGALLFDTPCLRQNLMLQFIDLFGIRLLDRSDETRDAPCFGVPTFGGLPGRQTRSGRPAPVSYTHLTLPTTPYV